MAPTIWAWAGRTGTSSGPPRGWMLAPCWRRRRAPGRRPCSSVSRRSGGVQHLGPKGVERFDQAPARRKWQEQQERLELRGQLVLPSLAREQDGEASRPPSVSRGDSPGGCALVIAPTGISPLRRREGDRVVHHLAPARPARGARVLAVKAPSRPKVAPTVRSARLRARSPAGLQHRPEPGLGRSLRGCLVVLVLLGQGQGVMLLLGWRAGPVGPALCGSRRGPGAARASGLCWRTWCSAWPGLGAGPGDGPLSRTKGCSPRSPRAIQREKVRRWSGRLRRQPQSKPPPAIALSQGVENTGL